MARLTEFEEDNWLLSEANKRLEKKLYQMNLPVLNLQNH